MERNIVILKQIENKKNIQLLIKEAEKLKIL